MRHAKGTTDRVLAFVYLSIDILGISTLVKPECHGFEEFSQEWVVKKGTDLVS
jgi:hypothetical protein